MANHKPNDTETVFKSAAEKLAEATDSLPEAINQAREFAKQNPLLVVAAGFGLGVLIGAWMKRD